MGQSSIVGRDARINRDTHGIAPVRGKRVISWQWPNPKKISALRQVAFDERRKIHDLLIEGVELALKKRGYPTLADMKAKWQRKQR